jgi:flagellar basal body-associated protein FliL
MIENYFNNLKDEQYKISYFKEDKPLGTAGSLSLLKDEITTRTNRFLVVGHVKDAYFTEFIVQ